MLRIEGLTVHYGDICAVRGVDLEVRQGETVALIGANGAGKSSILNTVAGLLRPSGGRILLNGQPIGGLPSHAVVSRGLVLVPEGRAMLGTMTVQDNLLLGASQRCGSREIRADMDTCYELFPRLRERSGQFADSLSGGEQQMLAVARAIMAKPSLMLLDEPSMGLSPLLAKEVFQIVRRIGAEGMTILLVEQNAKLALSVASRAYVLEQGKVASSGARAELLDNAAVVAAYLGRSAATAR